MASVPYEMLKELECPVCMQFLTSPIVLCNNGHSICIKCRRNVQQCPICRSGFSDVRCRAFEIIMKKLKFQCKNQAQGCTEVIGREDIKDHVQFQCSTCETTMSLLDENDLLKELECPVCLELMLPPILLCKSGHSVCSKCRSHMEKCPTCRSEFVVTRNVIAENLSMLLKHPCKFHNSGCGGKFLSSSKSSHEEECAYRPRKCPFSNVDLCPWLGTLDEMKEHIKDSHSYLTSTGADGVLNPCFTQVSKSRGWSEAVFSLGEMFFMFTKVVEGFLYTTVTYLGTNEEAKNYTFCITFMTVDCSEGSSSYKVCPSYLSFIDKFEKDNCAVFPLALVEKCVNPEDELYFQYEIRVSDSCYFPIY